MDSRALGWLLAAVTSLFALVSVIVYMQTGAFTQRWLLASALVYGGILATSLLLLAFDRARAPEKVEHVMVAGVEPRLVDRTSVYRTEAGQVWRLTYARSDERRDVRHVVDCGGELMTVGEIETYVDALPASPEPADFDRILAEAIDRHAIPEQKSQELIA